jgi:signal transduction histidine kinase
VLEPFGQVQHHGEEQIEGTGLGLPLVKSFIEAQDGAFALDSTVGEGTTVTLWFPPARILEGDAAAA